MQQAKTSTNIKIQDLCYIALFAAMIAVLAQISIPLPAGVPLTLQTLAVPLAGLVLGRKRGTLATLVYLLLGAAGVPVFAGMKGGIHILFGMTGGFLVSFPLMAYAAGLGIEMKQRSSREYNCDKREEVSVNEKTTARSLTRQLQNNLYLWAGLVIGALVNYVVGTVWFMIVAHTALMPALSACVIPFIPTAIFKLILAGILGTLLRQALMKAQLI